MFEIFTLFENPIQGRKGQLEKDFDADLVIFAPDETQLVRKILFLAGQLKVVQNSNRRDSIGTISDLSRPVEGRF